MLASGCGLAGSFGWEDSHYGVSIAAAERRLFPAVREMPDELPPADQPVTGLLEADDDPDEEVAELGDAQARPPAEEAAMHLTDPPPMGDGDGYVGGYQDEGASTTFEATKP